jgi:hypothetical protein
MPQVVKQTNKAPAKLAAPSKEDAIWGMATDTVRMLIYGASATGKTTFVSTFPGPTLWLICSGSDKPGELKSINTPENRKKIHPRIVQSSSQMRDYLKEAEEYQTVVLDHGSGLADLILKEILGLEELPAQKNWGLAKMQDYGQQSQQCKEIFRAMLNLPGNVVIIAQERLFGGKDEGIDPEILRPTVGPNFSPSLCNWICPAVDYLVQTFKGPKTETTMTKIAGKDVPVTQKVKGAEYHLRTGPSDTFMTKFRIPKELVLPDSLVNPDYTSFLELLRVE